MTLFPEIPLVQGKFEAEDSLAAAFELSGRITALFRSLRLAPMFQGLQDQAARQQDPQGGAAQRLAALGSGLDCQVDGLAIRRWEASQSYAWAQGIVPYCSSRWPGDDSSLAPRWSVLRDRVETVTSIHLAAHGSNLAHTCFTPEHLLTLSRRPLGYRRLAGGTAALQLYALSLSGLVFGAYRSGQYRKSITDIFWTPCRQFIPLPPTLSPLF